MKTLQIIALFFSIAVILFNTGCTLINAENEGKLDERNTVENLAATPPMGWNSWNSFGIEVTEEQVKAVADYMAEHLKEYGWEYVVVDAGWYHPASFKTPEWNTDPEPPQYMDEFGRLIPDPEKFPSSKNGKGFKPLADYVHSKGLKFGIHIMRGIPWNAVNEKRPIKETGYTANEVAEFNNRCEWTNVMVGMNMTHPGGMAYYESLVELYEEWDVDYIKADDMSRPYRVDEVQAFSKALQNGNRPIVLSLSPGAAPIMAAKDLREHAHLWRISGDFWDTWSSLREMFDLCEMWAPYIAENHWPDADMLPLGKLRKNGVGEWEASLFNATSEEVSDEFTRLPETEQITLMNLWAIFKSPLMMGGYLPENDEFTLSLLTNEKLLEINQHSTNNRVIFQDENEAAWAAESADGKTNYVALFNLSDDLRTVELNVGEIGLDEKKTWEVSNAWNDSKTAITGLLETELQPHESVIYLLNEQ